MSRSKWLFLVVFFLSLNGMAADFNFPVVQNSHKITTQDFLHEGSDPFFPDFARTTTDYNEERLVVTMSLINKKKKRPDIIYGGTFAPSVGLSLKPFRNSRFKTFTQATCLDYYCQNIILSFGIKTNVGNPYAYAEPKLVLSRIDGKRNRFSTIN